MERINDKITVRNLSFKYDKKTVLKDVNCNIISSFFTCILGPNGSGKSTFIRLLSGLLSYKQGTIDIFGYDLNSLHPARRSKLIGYLGQHHKAIFPFKVFDVILTGRAGNVSFYPSREDRLITSETIEKIGLGHLVEASYNELSGGEQQLVMIARILAQKPKILLLDEPTSHLDLANQVVLFQLISDIVKQGITVIAVLHDPTSAFLYGNDFLFVHDKSIIRPSNNISHADQNFLSSIYGTKLKCINVDNISLVIPNIAKYDQ